MDRDPPGDCTYIFIFVSTIIFCSTRRITMHDNRTITSWKYIVYTAIECHAETKDSRRKLPSSPTVITSLLYSIVDKTIGKMKKKPCGHYCTCDFRFVWPRFFSLRWTIIIYTITVRCKYCSVCHNWYPQ